MEEDRFQQARHPDLNTFNPPGLFEGDINKISHVNGTNELVNNAERSAELLSKSQEILDADGNRIINATEKKIWFANNIAFVFVRGIGFDERDFEKLNKLVSLFSTRPDCSYLLNRHYEIDYYDELAISLETHSSISNGNYHVMLAVMSYANEETMKTAGAIPSFGTNRIVEVLTDFKLIEKTMNEYLFQFGFLAHYDRSNEITTAQSRGSYLQPDGNRSRINIDISMSSLPQPTKEDFESQQAMLNEQNLRRERVEQAISQRAPKNITEDQRLSKSKSLMSRIRERQLEVTQPTEMGGTLRMNEYWMPPDERKPELQFYPNMNYSYDESTASNYFVNANPAYKDQLPKALYTPTPSQTTAQPQFRLPIGNSALVLPK